MEQAAALKWLLIALLVVPILAEGDWGPAPSKRIFGGVRRWGSGGHNSAMTSGTAAAAAPKLSRGCHMPRRGVRLPEVSLPAWFRFDNWPEISEVAAQPNMNTFNGQDKEDRIAYEHLFWNRASGVYLEFGAANGYELSNTLWFHQQLGWRGILIEANPESYKQLIDNRPADVAVHAAVCANFTTVHFHSQGLTGGIWEFMAPSFRSFWAPNTTVEQLPRVSCMPLTPLLAKFGVRHIDFWSLDVEGGELEVLKTHNFNCISVDVIVIEADGHSPAKDQAVRDLLISKGFKLWRKSQGGNSIERNDWFVHESFVPSAKPGLESTA